MLYFSYGSNMSSRRLLERAPSATFLSIGTLKEHKLRFHKKSKDGSGKCDAVHTANRDDCVMGVVFAMSASDKKELDQKECLGFGYEEKTVTVLLENGDRIEASTYCTPKVSTLTRHKLRLRGGIKKNAVETDAALNPYSWYKEHVLRGARENNLPHDYISIIEKIKSLPDPDMDRHEQELAIYT
ncbi:gamma-glutamylcyclotransferase family protein [Thermodesulfobacteriota bacterium]